MLNGHSSKQRRHYVDRYGEGRSRGARLRQNRLTMRALRFRCFPVSNLATAERSRRALRLHDRQTLCRGYLAHNVICCHHCIQRFAPVYFQSHCQLQSIESAEPEDVAVLLKESLGFRVVIIGYRDYCQQACNDIIQKVISQSSRIGGAQRTHPNPSCKNRVHLDGGQARNDHAALRLPEKGFDPVGSRFWLVPFGESTRIKKIATHSESVLTLIADISRQRAGHPGENATYLFEAWDVVRLLDISASALHKRVVDHGGERIFCIGNRDADLLVLLQEQWLQGPKNPIFIDSFDLAGHVTTILRQDGGANCYIGYRDLGAGTRHYERPTFAH